MLTTSVGLFILGGIGPCTGLHDSNGYYNYSCDGVCCQKECGASGNICEAFPHGMIYMIAGIMMGAGVLISGGLYVYKRWL